MSVHVRPESAFTLLRNGRSLWGGICKRRTHSPEFKSKVALAAIKGDLTMAEMVKKFDVHANQITEWKKQLLNEAPEVFGKGAKMAEDTEEAVQALHAKIGQLQLR